MWQTPSIWKKKWFESGFATGNPHIVYPLPKCTLLSDLDFLFLRRRQKEKRINPPIGGTGSGSPSSPASPPSMASPGGGFFGVQPGGSTTPPTSLTPFSGSPG